MVEIGSLSLTNTTVVLLIVIKSIIPKVGTRNDLNKFAKLNGVGLLN